MLRRLFASAVVVGCLAWPTCAQTVDELIERAQARLAGWADAGPLKKIEAAFRRQVTLDFAETPIEDVVTFVADFAAVNIVLDRNAVPAERRPITLKVKDASLEAAMNHILRQAQLTYGVVNEAVFITNAEGLKGSAGEPVLRARDLRYLAVMAGEKDAGNLIAYERERRRAARDRIRAALEKPVTLDFADTPIQDVCTFVADFAAMNIALDPHAAPRGREGIKITLKVKDIPLKNALDFVLKQARLKSAIWDEALFVSNDAGLAGREQEAADLLKAAREALQAGHDVKALDLLETLRIEYSDTQAYRQAR
ncbi:MAG: hypothetical protein FJ279_05900 [Planctomycetes bacterium]|nr:hypothetical protein [Planctomycetota bacterium]MBM4078654.1 hypothetical protein [Planctomycetota bacterium]MBM4083642.1 hypothetical protein [Planctomycetota bacterium]